MRDGGYENLSEARRAELCRVEEDNRIIDQLVARGEVGAESGVDFEFDIDDFVTEMVTEK